MSSKWCGYSMRRRDTCALWALLSMCLHSTCEMRQPIMRTAHYASPRYLCALGSAQYVSAEYLRYASAHSVVCVASILVRVRSAQYVSAQYVLVDTVSRAQYEPCESRMSLIIEVCASGAL